MCFAVATRIDLLLTHPRADGAGDVQVEMEKLPKQRALGLGSLMSNSIRMLEKQPRHPVIPAPSGAWLLFAYEDNLR